MLFCSNWVPNHVLPYFAIEVFAARMLGGGKTGANTIEVAWTPPVKEELSFSLDCCISHVFSSSWFGSRLVNVGRGYLAESTGRKSQKRWFGKPHRCLDGCWS